MAPGWGNSRLKIKLKNCNVWRDPIIESQITEPSKVHNSGSVTATSQLRHGPITNL
jgi:hypothetical protein